MPFGLSDVGSTFQRMANTIFDDLITCHVVIVYLDDILIHTNTWAEHLQVLQEVLKPKPFGLAGLKRLSGSVQLGLGLSLT